jgi:hypothetical protein
VSLPPSPFLRLSLALPLFRFRLLPFSFTRSYFIAKLIVVYNVFTNRLPLALTLRRLVRCRFLYVCRLLSFSFASARVTVSSCCQSPVLVASSMCVACSLSLSIPLALTIHRQTHRRLQCLSPLISACSFSSSFDDCIAVASSLSTACSLSLSLLSLFLPFCPTCCFLFLLQFNAKLIVVFNVFAHNDENA